jgi:hypothetical protein
MHNTDKVPDCLVFNLALLELYQVIIGAQQVVCIFLEFPAIWFHCFASSSLRINWSTVLNFYKGRVVEVIHWKEGDRITVLPSTGLRILCFHSTL